MEALKEALPEGISAATASIPGYGMIAQLVSRTFGFDLGDIVSLYLVLFGVYQAGLYLWNRAWSYYREGFTSTIRVDDDDDLYIQFISWISAQQMTKVSRDLKASTLRSRAYDDDDYDDSDVDDTKILDESGFFSFEKWSGTNPVYYEPNFGDAHFTYEGRYFEFSKDEKENKYNQRWEKFVVIRCMGRSSQPIKDLIEHVKEWYGIKDNNMTIIYRSSSRRHGEGGYWEWQATRPSRPLSTVSLDEEQKKKLVADINDYLMPRTSRWYAARGIPYRRGYLFHGPPGTGKTSLSFALAGIFGLGIYSASLSEPELTEANLGRLFAQLPRRCIVLLEDIDSAGIRREEDLSLDAPTSGSGASSNSGDETSKEDVNKNKSVISRLCNTVDIRTWISQVPEATKTDETADDDDSSKDSTKGSGGVVSKSNITLAGLLNIIDGAASHEGRVLIMTTNIPEKLDSALIRPGRVDLQIKFTHATREQIRDIFKRMYSTKLDEKKRNKDKDTDTKATCQCGHSSAKSATNSMLPIVIPPARLAEMAEEFANQIPECALSPAEIQGYLLINKADANGALEGVKEWAEKVLDAKKKGKKVLDVV